MPKRKRAALRARKERKSLSAFAGTAASCPICALPPDAYAQVHARGKGVLVDTVIAWLKSEYAITTTRTDFDRHAKGHHHNNTTATPSRQLSQNRSEK